MILIITGKNASGKSTVCNLLKERGYTYYSLSDELRKVAKEKGIGPTRENLIKLGNEYRTKEGGGVWAKLLCERLRSIQNREIGQITDIVVDSIRSPFEIEELRTLSGFGKLVVIGVDAPIEVRFERAKLRRRSGDGDTLEEFSKKEREEITNDPNKQQLQKCFDLADFVVDNSRDETNLKRELDLLFAKIRTNLT